MKKRSILILTLLFSVLFAHSLSAQEETFPPGDPFPGGGGDPPETSATIGMTVVSSTVAHNSKVTFTFTGETSTDYVTIPPQYSEYDPYVSGTFFQYVSFTPSPAKAGNVTYTIANTHTAPVTLMMKFRVGVRNVTTNSTNYIYIEVQLTVNPAPVIPTRYYIHRNQVTKAVYDQLLWDDSHGDDPMDGSYKTTYYSATQAVSEFGITDGGDAYNIELKNQGPPGM